MQEIGGGGLTFAHACMLKIGGYGLSGRSSEVDMVNRGKTCIRCPE